MERSIEDGEKNPEVASSRAFDQSAINAFGTRTYKPETLADKPIAMYRTIRIDFTLDH